MARSRLCRSCGDFHDLEQAWPESCASHFGVAASDAPMIRTDGMDPIRSMADGRMYDSKSGYYGSVRRAGCEIVGDDRKPFDRRPEFVSAGVGRDIKQAIEQLRSR